MRTEVVRLIFILFYFLSILKKKQLLLITSQLYDDIFLQLFLHLIRFALKLFHVPFSIVKYDFISSKHQFRLASSKLKMRKESFSLKVIHLKTLYKYLIKRITRFAFRSASCWIAMVFYLNDQLVQIIPLMFLLFDLIEVFL